MNRRTTMKLLIAGLSLSALLFSGCATKIQTSIEVPNSAVIGRMPGIPDPLIEELEQRRAETEVSGPLVSGSYFDTDIRAVLMELSVKTGIKLIPDQSVQGMLTLSFAEMRLEEVLNMILYSGGWAFKKENGYYLIGSADPNNPASARLMVTESLITNSAAGSVRKGLPAMYQSYVSVPDSIGHRLTINAPENLLWKIKQAVSAVDKARKLIAVNVVVAEVTMIEGMAAGLDWGESILSIDSAAGIEAQTGSLPLLTGAVGADLSITLLAMGKTGSVDIRANPKIVALDGESAVVEIITNQYMPIIDSSDNLSSTDVKVISSGISLTVLPRITRDGEILLQVEPIVSDQSGTSGSSGLPVINTRRTSTTVKLRSMETFMLGGLIEEHRQTSMRNAGYTAENVRKELIIFLTPEIL
ncbi:MAG: type II and III secretion system protein [Spirochaetales bacterium]|nr:type II and III secretion system protein [Spirochaetales bacterium]